MYPLLPYMRSLPCYQQHSPAWPVCKDGPTLINHNHPKSIVYPSEKYGRPHESAYYPCTQAILISESPSFILWMWHYFR